MDLVRLTYCSAVRQRKFQETFAVAAMFPLTLLFTLLIGSEIKGVGLDSRAMPNKAASIGRCAYMSLIRRGAFAVGVIAFAGAAGLLGSAAADTAPVKLAANAPASEAITTATTPDDYKKMMMQYCTACHNDRLKTGGMWCVPLDADNLPANEATWEEDPAQRQPGRDAAARRAASAQGKAPEFTNWLATSLDSRRPPIPIRATPRLRRLNRTEYANAVRDLLALDVDCRQGHAA